MQGSYDLTQPSLKAVSLVKNKNNVSDRELSRQLHIYEREKTLSILNIDHDRLDMKDFLRQLRQCHSDDLPEARHWLGGPRRREEQHTIRNISTAPAGGARDPAPDREEKMTQPLTDEELVRSGRFRTRREQDDSQKLTMFTILQRRAQLVDAGPVWDQTQSSHTPKQAPHAQDPAPPTPEPVKREVTFKDTHKDKSRRKEDKTRTTQKRPPEILVLHCGDETSKKVTAEADPETVQTGRTRRRERTLLASENKPDFMKELLVTNAKQRYRRRPPKPLEDRLSTFYSHLDDWKLQAGGGDLSDKETRRRYLVLTKGVKAALADSSDEDENVEHTV